MDTLRGATQCIHPPCESLLQRMAVVVFPSDPFQQADSTLLGGSRNGSSVSMGGKGPESQGEGLRVTASPGTRDTGLLYQGSVLLGSVHSTGEGLCCLQGLGHFPPGMRKSSPKQDKQCWRTATPRSRGAGHDQQLTLSPCPAAAVSWQCHSPWPSLQPQPSHQSSAQAPGWDQRDMCWKQAVIPKASLNSCEKCYTRS